jgi:hypothetical protein
LSVAAVGIGPIEVGLGAEHPMHVLEVVPIWPAPMKPFVSDAKEAGGVPKNAAIGHAKNAVAILGEPRR